MSRPRRQRDVRKEEVPKQDSRIQATFVFNRKSKTMRDKISSAITMLSDNEEISISGFGPDI